MNNNSKNLECYPYYPIYCDKSQKQDLQNTVSILNLKVQNCIQFRIPGEK